MTLYPLPEINLEMPTPAFNKYRRAISAGVVAFNESRRVRSAIAAHKAAEFKKLDKFFRNCAMNGRVNMAEW